MTINKLTIDKYDGENPNEIKLDNRLSVIALPEYEEAFRKAAEKLSYPLDCEVENEYGKVSGIKLEIADEAAGSGYACKEYLSCKLFNCNCDSLCAYSKRLKRYYYCTDEYREHEFSDITGSLGETNVFRSFLRSYIKDFEPVLISKEKGIYVCIEKDGEFKPKEKDETGFKIIRLNSKEQHRFEYMCFLLVNSFWEEAELLRTADIPKYPLLVAGKWSELQNTEISKLLGNMPFQTLVFTALTCVPITGHN